MHATDMPCLFRFHPAERIGDYPVASLQSHRVIRTRGHHAFHVGVRRPGSAAPKVAFAKYTISVIVSLAFEISFEIQSKHAKPQGFSRVNPSKLKRKRLLTSPILWLPNGHTRDRAPYRPAMRAAESCVPIRSQHHLAHEWVGRETTELAPRPFI
jgi:hypothetical protein